MTRSVALALALAACGDDAPPSFFADPTAALPPQLSTLLAGSDELLVPYAPTWPLWSSGSTKDRAVFVAGAIDTSAPGAWQFPDGTLFIKTFAYERPIETRILRRLDGGWTYDVYVWDGTDATLAPLDARIAVDLGDGTTHTIPERLDCRTCHESSPSPVLGFTELQLDDATLATLDARALRTTPNASPERIVASDAATRDVLGLFQGNCVHCHNGTTGANAAYDLRYPVALANTINVPTSSSSAEGLRIVPGDPDASILVRAFAREVAPALKAMPPLGIDRPDTSGLAQLRAWVEQLP